MEIDFDPQKDRRNREIHGLSLDQARFFAWDTAVSWQDSRRDYRENRYVALGFIGLRLHCMVYTDRINHRRIISLRRANLRENQRYAQAQTRTH